MTLSQQVQDFFDARRQVLADPERLRSARQTLLARDKQEVLAEFETRLERPSDEDRTEAVEGLALLYRGEATPTLIRLIHDASSLVRWKVCDCLHDFGDERAAEALLDRMRNDNDCQVRGVAAAALGNIGSTEALPELYHVAQTDRDVDELGHTPADQACEAMTSVLRLWVTRRIHGAAPETFRESTTKGELRGAVTAEAIPFDAEGRIHRTTRYSHLPTSAFGNGWSSMIDLETSLVSPFEIEVEYVDPTCEIRRVFVYLQIPDSATVNWAVHTVLEAREA